MRGRKPPIIVSEEEQFTKVFRSRTVLALVCPRCRGKMMHDRDAYGEYGSCINCGYHQSVVVGLVEEVEPPTQRGPSTRRGGRIAHL